jgi:hypothetical protein
MSLDFAQVANGKPQATKQKKTAAVHVAALMVPKIEPVQHEFAKYKPQLTELEKQAKALEVKDQSTFQLAVDGAATAKGLIKAIDGRKSEITSPYREFINQVNNAAKFFTEPLKNIADSFSRKSGDYQYQLELARRRQEKAIEEANRKLQEDLEKQAKKDGIEAPTVTPVKPAKPQNVIHTAGGHSQHLRREWVGEIENPEKVPREYCSPDQRLINNAVKMGVRSIEGVKIYEKVSAVHR